MRQWQGSVNSVRAWRAKMPCYRYSSRAAPLPQVRPLAPTFLAKNAILKSQNDKKREYAHLKLPNQLEALLISDPDTKESAAAMDVMAGYFSDPRDIAGLAHFCEHMLFLVTIYCVFLFFFQSIVFTSNPSNILSTQGTEKYPDEKSYKQFLTKHGGHANASTGSEHTNYFFSVNSGQLNGALDRFSSFFTCPLFTESATEREMNAVHAEFKRNVQDDSRRILQCLKHTSNQQHPFSKFSTGNLESLSRSDVNVMRQQLMEFHKTYYVPERMRLVCYGKGLSYIICKKYIIVTLKGTHIHRIIGCALRYGL